MIYSPLTQIVPQTFAVTFALNMLYNISVLLGIKKPVF